MKSIQQFISSLSITPALKEELAAEQLLRKHNFYLRLARYLAPAFPQLPEDTLSDLTGYSYLYFRFLLGFDSLLDGQVDSQGAAQRLFASISLHEQAVRGLARLFPAPDSFWTDFELCKQEYTVANLQEKEHSARRQPFTETQFEEMAAGKSAVCYAMVHALSSLSRSTESVAQLRSCLRHLHIAMQYLDDIEDFKSDRTNGQFTYAYSQVEQVLQAQGIAVEQLSASVVHRHLYTSGVAQQLLRSSSRHYAVSIADATSLGLTTLVHYLQQQADKCANYQQDVDRLLQKTRIKAGKSFVPLHAEAPLLAPSTLQDAVSHALRHLRRSRDTQGCWSDFMTSAGQSKLWVTAYAGLQLADLKEGAGIAHDAFNASAFLPASYNESIMQDGDSTTFGMGLSRKVWGEATTRQLAAWLAFMEADGGWVTYRDASQLRRRLEIPTQVSVEAWLTPKLCVTAAAAAVLKLYPELEPQYRLSCDYLARHQHADGFWDSYWWTSPIYATTFAVLALAPLPKYAAARETALQWLAGQQHPDGAWYDSTLSPQPSAFFTALALKALLTNGLKSYEAVVERGVEWLLAQQTQDGSWLTSRILRIPATDVQQPDTVRHWRASSFGVNVLVDDHNRIFTTSTVANALGTFARLTAPVPTYS